MDAITHLVPFLRFPLIINDAVAISLTFAAIDEGQFWWENRDPSLGLAITLIISLNLTVLFAIKHFLLRDRKESAVSHNKKAIIYGAAAVLEIGLAVVLIVLHVLNVIKGHDYVTMMYAAFGALIAR